MAQSTNKPSKASAQAQARQDPERLYWRGVEQVARGGMAEPEAGVRRCDHSGCAAEGLHRAPKSKGNLRDYYWFCLPHVQEYNRGWNFYDGFSIDDMEDARRQDMVGWRPTWPLGKLGAGDRHKEVSPDTLRAHIFAQFFGSKKAKAGFEKAMPADGLLPDERAALASFGLKPAASWQEIKRRYKELALAYHPDLHHGADDAAQAEMQIKLINRAYTILKRRQIQIQNRGQDS